MTASTEILIGDPNGQSVLIRAVSRAHPGLFDYWDGNWIHSEVEVAAGGFRGGFRADVRSEEFASFLAELEALDRSLDGVAEFTTMEGQIALTLTGDGKGHVRVQGEAVDTVGTGNRLQFAFDIDQSCLPAVQRSLEHVLRAFPVTGEPDARET